MEEVLLSPMVKSWWTLKVSRASQQVGLWEEQLINAQTPNPTSRNITRDAYYSECFVPAPLVS